MPVSKFANKTASKRKFVSRNFVVLPHENTTVVPIANEWTRYSAMGIGMKALTIYKDATAKELKDAIYRYFAISFLF